MPSCSQLRLFLEGIRLVRHRLDGIAGIIRLNGLLIQLYDDQVIDLWIPILRDILQFDAWDDFVDWVDEY
jgi:hypothetical protein